MEGYPEKIEERLKNASIDIGDKVRVTKEGNEFEGLLLPRTEKSSENIVIKLENGYN
ncbi:MAG: Glu-tRNA(Gln) amidotransferase GatDE subunit D, partial [Candidatus Aenigmatarchaeota archaeon]